MSGEVIHLRAYEAAIFRGSREKPIWDPADIAECERNLRHPAVRERLEEVALRARAERDWLDEQIRIAYATTATGFTPGGNAA